MAIVGTVLPAHAAQDMPEPEEIIVSVERVSPTEARARAVAFVQHTGITKGKESVARWIDPICPRAVGVAAEHAGLVEAKVRAIASAAGVPVAKPGCLRNVIINFVGDGNAFVRSVSARDPGQLAKVPPHRRAALFNGGAPVRWWYSTEMRSRDGDRSTDLPPAALGSGSVLGAQLPGNGDATSLSLFGSSMVSAQTARALRRATVVVDTVRAEGVTLDNLAAYAAMVALAEMQPPDEPLAGSILSLFDADVAPPTITKLDLAFLRELYRLPLDRKARQQKGRIVRALQNEQLKKFK